MVLSTYKRRALEELRNVTEISVEDATELLSMCEWDVSEAAETLYAGAFVPSHRRKPAPPKIDMDKAKSWFNIYEDSETPKTMQVEGILRFFEDLHISPEDIVVIVIAKYFQARNMFVFTEAEFLKGLTALGVDSLADFQSKLPDLIEEIDDFDEFKELYKFTFGWACPPSQKSVKKDTAIALWRLLLGNQFQYLDQWCEYVETVKKQVISRDEWQLLLEFASVTKDSLSGYDENEAWPVIIDDFVETLRNKSN